MSSDRVRPTRGRGRRLPRAALAVAVAAPLVLGGAAAAPAVGQAERAGVAGSGIPEGAPPGTWATYPDPGRGTGVIDRAEKLSGFAEPAWYESNIPFVDIPDEEIEDTYYYRWRAYKEALKDTGAQDGWIVSEFLGPVGYSAPNGGIVAAAGHHLYEGRWLRDQRYLDDYVDYWLTGSGSGPKPATDGLNENTTDWSHQYSFWVADAVLARAAVDGRTGEAAALLPELEEQWQGWAPQLDDELGLYWQTPVWDAMEYTASSYQSDDPYHGGDGFRPTLNAYQFGDAKAIAELARLAGDDATAQRYEAAAADLQQAQERWLWDEEDGFYKHVMRDDNPDRTQLDDREQIGFVPWYFGMAPPENARAWAQLTDPQGFAARFGPTTVERRSPWFMHEALQGCCRWDGPSWPYSTSQTLTAMANLLLEEPDQPYVDAGDYYDLLRGYALTQRKDGQPYVAEAHHPDEDRWLYDGRNHSEDYNHSTFNDLVLSGLLGIRPQTGDSVRLAPLAPSTWDHWAVEDVAYHGRNLSVLWDADGSAYGRGAGLSVYLDGRLVHRQGDTSAVEVPVSTVETAPADQLPELVDDLVDVDGNGPQVATASYTGAVDSPANAIDGQDFHLDVPNTRWTTYGSPSSTDWLEVDLGAPTEVSDVSVVFYDDGGGVRAPAAYELQHRTADGTWAPLPGQHRYPAQPVGRAVNRVVLDEPVRTDALRLVVTPQPGAGVGVTTIRALREEDPRVELGVEGLGEDGVIDVRPGQTVEVVTTATAAERTSLFHQRLLVPRGWTVERVGRDRPVTVGPGTVVRTTWRVSAPADLPVTRDLPLRLLVDSRGATAGTTGLVVPTRAELDLATFPTTLWDDDFSTDRTGDYAVDAAAGEALPALSVADGALTAAATSRSFGLLRAPVEAGERVAVVVEPRAFAGTGAAEDSLFTGLAAGPGDYALGWYNHSRSATGTNVVVDGAGRSDAEGAGGPSTRWAPGDRFAAVVEQGRLSTWHEHDGRWTRLTSAPVTAAVAADELARWAPAVGLRLDPGSISLDRLTVLGGTP